MKIKLILCAALFLSACQQETIPSTDHAENHEILSEAGRIHNEMIFFYYDNRTFEPGSLDEIMRQVLNLSWKYLEANGYHQQDLNETRLLVEKHFSETGLKSVAGDDFSIDTVSFVQHMRETGLYSDYFQHEVKKILTLAHKEDDRKAVRKYVNKTFAKLTFDEGNDIRGQQLYVNIFNGSYEFWEMMEETQLKGVQLKKSSWVIINDGIGGILGLVFGPVGSIVTATAFSVGTNEEINR